MSVNPGMDVNAYSTHPINHKFIGLAANVHFFNSHLIVSDDTENLAHILRCEYVFVCALYTKNTHHAHVVERKFFKIFAVVVLRHQFIC